jgi:hypothetical protein
MLSPKLTCVCKGHLKDSTTALAYMKISKQEAR